VNSRLDGRCLHVPHEAHFDVVVVGSGPAGSAAAAAMAAGGARVAVVEEGRWFSAEEMPLDAFGALADAYREMGVSLCLGRAAIPYLQGCAVGGSALINGAICWRLPRDIHAEWVAADPPLAAALPWEELEAVTDELELLHQVAPTAAEVSGRKNLLMARGADALGLEHRPIRRNVSGCRGLGRCLQGCPEGHKLTPERTLLPRVEAADGRILSSVRVDRILLDRHRRRAIGVEGGSAGGARVRILARRAVVLAASAIQTPALLLRNRIRHGPVGRNLSAHPGASLSARFPSAVRMWQGATQGHEVIGLRHEGLKFEALGFGNGLLAARLPGVGRDLAAAIADLDRWLNWGVAVRAGARGRVQLLAGRTLVRYQLTPHDLALLRRGLRVMGEMLFAAGAEQVRPDIRGFDPVLRDPRRLAALEAAGPTDPAAYHSAISHLFGTCRMGSDSAVNVVRPDFRHHAIDRLYIADSSLFPSNIGVNPQIAIMALATLCGRRVVATSHSNH
jgi:choline dehydrogenase-like flavoprotein